MNRRIEKKLRKYLNGAITLSQFYHWYMNWRAYVVDGGIVTHEEDNRVTLVLYEYTSEPIYSMPDREDWLRKELQAILDGTGRWKEE